MSRHLRPARCLSHNGQSLPLLRQVAHHSAALPEPTTRPVFHVFGWFARDRCCHWSDPTSSEFDVMPFSSTRGSERGSKRSGTCLRSERLISETLCNRWEEVKNFQHKSLSKDHFTLLNSLHRFLKRNTIPKSVCILLRSEKDIIFISCLLPP